MERDTVADIIEDVVRRQTEEFLGKDSITRWKRVPHTRPNVRTRAINIVRHLPGAVNEARNAKTPLQCFELMVNDAIIDIIVTNTNLFIDMLATKFSRIRDCKRTDKTEIEHG